MHEPTFDDIRTASSRISPCIHRTPVFTSSAINKLCRREVFFKCENFQKTGSFKIRGAANTVLSLTTEAASRGVATHSSGNHAAALAYAAALRGVKAYVVMPNSAPRVKKDAVAAYGAEIIFCEPSMKAREETLKQVTEKTRAVAVHPYNDYRIIAGQGTAASELCQEVSDLDAVLAPIGGGGLLSGTAIAVSSLSPRTKVVGAEPENADDAARSFRAGHIIPLDYPATVADGLRTTVGGLTFPIILRLVSDILTAGENAILSAMRLVWERMKIVIEPSSAVPLAVLLTHPDAVPGRRVGVILSGGNVDVAALARTFTD